MTLDRRDPTLAFVKFPNLCELCRDRSRPNTIPRRRFLHETQSDGSRSRSLVACARRHGRRGLVIRGRPTAAAATKLTVWVGWSAGTELKEFKALVAEYDKKNAGVEIKVVGGINDNKIIAALRSGNAPDVVSSFSSQNVGIYCPSGGWIDLGPLLKRDKIDVNIFPAATRYYTQYKGMRCALPLLADVYGFYYNKKLFKEAGLTRPPKTFSELTAYAKKLTKKNADGTFKVVGYDPESDLLPRRRGHVGVRHARRREVLHERRQVEPGEATRPGPGCSNGRRA